MADIRHRVGIQAPITDVYDAVATREGLSTWWTRDVVGDAVPGGELAFRFGRPEASAVMTIIDLSPPDRVVWECVHGPDEWLGTRITFELRRNGDETVVLFTHGGWREPVEFMHHCSTKWGYFLLGLKAGLEGGLATPFPEHALVSTWG